MKSVYVKSSTYIDFDKENKEKPPKFKVSDHVRISKYKNMFANDYVSNSSGEIFVIQKVKATALQTYLISDLNRQNIFGKSYKKELQKASQKKFRIKEVTKGNGFKLHVMSDRKVRIINSKFGLTKKYCFIKISYFLLL